MMFRITGSTDAALPSGKNRTLLLTVEEAPATSAREFSTGQRAKRRLSVEQFEQGYPQAENVASFVERSL